jgi:hypothetical protein
MQKMEFHAVKCAYCGRVFTALNGKAKYDSTACRSAAYRQRKRHETNEPVPGIRSEYAIMYTDLASQSPYAAKMVAALRTKRGVRAAEDAIVIALAAVWPMLVDDGSQSGEFYRANVPEYLRREGAA